MTALTPEPDPELPPGDQIDAAKSLSRNAFAQILNTGAVSILGFVFWALAARNYSAYEIGQDSALVSAMMLLAACSELDLGLAIPRFLPQLGSKSSKAVVLGYCASTLMAMIVTGLTVVIVPHLSKSLHFLGGDFGLAIILWLAVVFWNVFSLQDAVLTALRRASWLPIENAIFGIAKLILMLVLAGGMLQHGIFLAWVIPMAVMVVPINYALFKYALPTHARTSVGQKGVFWDEGGRRKVVKFLAQDWGASLLMQGATTLAPLLVVVLLGAKENGYFYIAFTISQAIEQLAHYVGLSLTVEGAFDETQLARLARYTFIRFGGLIVVGVGLLVIIAPWVLRIYGSDYSDNATTVLRLLAVASIPQVVLNLYQAVERVRGHGGRVLAITFARFGLVVLFVVACAKPWGLTGVGIGWVVGHVVVMAFAIPPLYKLMRK